MLTALLTIGKFLAAAGAAIAATASSSSSNISSSINQLHPQNAVDSGISIILIPNDKK